jgi:hypothetical protein
MKLGGRNNFVRRALENPTAFLRLIGRILPTTLTGDPESPVSVEVRPVAQHPERARQLIRDACGPLGGNSSA